MRVLLLLFLILVTAQACDTQNAIRELEYVSVATLDGFYARNDTVVHNLDWRFTPNQEIVQYEWSNPDGKLDISASGIRDQILNIVALTPGPAEIVAKAVLEGGQSVSGTIKVNSLDPCPRRPNPSEAEYFPINVGDRWQYSYSYLDSQANAERVTGTLTWEVASAIECNKGESIFVVDAVLEGQRRKSDFQTGQTHESAISRKTQFEIVVNETVDLGSFYGTPIQRIHDAQVGPRVSLSGSGVQVYPSSETSMRITSLKLDRDIGVVAREIRIHWGVSRDVTEGISLMSHELQ